MSKLSNSAQFWDPKMFTAISKRGYNVVYIVVSTIKIDQCVPKRLKIGFGLDIIQFLTF